MDGHTLPVKIKNTYNHAMQIKVGVPIYSAFNVKKNERGQRGSKNNINNNLNTNSNVNDFDLDTWHQQFISDTSSDDNMIHSLRTWIFKLKKQHMKLLFLDNARKMIDGNTYIHPKHMYMHYIIRDLCLYKLQKTYKKPNKTFMVVDYVNRLIDKINLSRLINCNDLKELFPVKSDFYSTPSISYTYSKTIRSTIVNYKETLMDPNYENITCHCTNYPTKYLNNHYGHIVTGDVDIIKNEDLRTLLKKGLDYHDQQPCNKAAANKSIKAAIDKYIQKVSPKLSSPVKAFAAWKIKLMNMVESKITTINKYKFNNILSKYEVKRELSTLQEHFVFVPVDKAAKNVSLVCKKFYLDTVNSEIEDSATFEKVSDNPDAIMQNLVHRYGNKNTEKLPFLYALTKMHKNPVKFRYITAGRDTFFSKMSIAVGKCLKLLMKTAQTSIQHKIKGLKSSNFVIDSREKVIQFLNISNNNSDRKQISTWDFSMLYTKIPLDKLKDQVAKFVRKIYAIISQSKKSDFITTSEKSKTAYFNKSRSKINVSYSVDELIQKINCIIDNSYILYRGKVYRQKIGIPMGTNCAPYLANIFLHTYEYDYLEKLVREGDIETAMLLSNTFRYQDDLIALNDDGMFCQHYNNIYPTEMNLENTNISKNVCTFLDLRISIFRGKFRYSSYDKRKDFNFDICNFPDLNGNIPYGNAYGVFLSQLVRFCDINSSIDNFFQDVKAMIGKLSKQGFDNKTLLETFMKFSVKYLYKWAKYGLDIIPRICKIFN